MLWQAYVGHIYHWGYKRLENVFKGLKRDGVRLDIRLGDEMDELIWAVTAAEDPS